MDTPIKKLYEIPNKSPMMIEMDDGKKKLCWYDHPDGMYSYCYLDEDHDKVFHLSVMTPMKIVGEHYEIAD